jgi:hypothetical protein
MTSDKQDLPLPDFDHIPLGTLPSRIAGLDEEGITALVEFERAHGNRVPVLTVLEGRLTQLHNGAEPSGGVPEDLPEVQQTQHDSAVSPETSGRDAFPPPAKSSPMLPSQPRR